MDLTFYLKIKKLFPTYKQIIFTGLLVGLGVFLMFFFITTTWIGMDVKQLCIEAKNQYGGDCVGALIFYLQDEKQHTPRERSKAVWALGQLGDSRALPVLKKYYDGSECDHKQAVCQYELKKAIRLIKSGFNITAFVWRYNLP
jgi:hypothetical protein